MVDNGHSAISEILNYLWLVAAGLFTALWRGQRSQDDRITKHQVETAKTYMTKPEIHKAIQDAIGPLRDDTREIKGDVKQLLKNSANH